MHRKPSTQGPLATNVLHVQTRQCSCQTTSPASVTVPPATPRGVRPPTGQHAALSSLTALHARTRSTAARSQCQVGTRAGRLRSALRCRRCPSTRVQRTALHTAHTRAESETCRTASRTLRRSSKASETPAWCHSAMCIPPRRISSQDSCIALLPCQAAPPKGRALQVEGTARLRVGCRDTCALACRHNRR